MPLCNYKIEQQYFTNSIVSSKTQTMLNAHSISNLSQQIQRFFFGSGKFRSRHGHFHLHLSSIQNTQQCSFVVHFSLLVSQGQKGRRQHLKSFRQKLWDSLPKHCMDAKNLGGFQAGRNWGNQVISAEPRFKSHSLCTDNHMQPGVPAQNMQESGKVSQGSIT